MAPSPIESIYSNPSGPVRKSGIPPKPVPNIIEEYSWLLSTTLSERGLQTHQVLPEYLFYFAGVLLHFLTEADTTKKSNQIKLNYIIQIRLGVMNYKLF